MIKKILFLMLFIIGCSINNSDSEWTQYQKLEYKVAVDYLGYQFDYEDLTIRLELPAFYVLNYSDGSKANIGARPKIIVYESKYANYDFLFSSDDDSVGLIWDGISLVNSIEKNVEDDEIIKKALEESIKSLENRIANISLIIGNLDGDKKSWMYESKKRKPIYNENGLIFYIKNTVLNKYIFLNNDLDNVDFALEITLDGNKEIISLKSIPKEKMNSFKSYINDQNKKYRKNAEPHLLD